MSDEDYDSQVVAKQQALNLKKKALKKLGIDESDVQEVSPVEFVGFNYDGDYMATKFYSSKYETTWLFFSENQIFMYNYIFDMTSQSKWERTEEYFYKDITKFSSSAESVEFVLIGKGCLGENTYSKGSYDISRFSIVVPGEKFTCATQGSDEIERTIQGLKQKLREKKN